MGSFLGRVSATSENAALSRVSGEMYSAVDPGGRRGGEAEVRQGQQSRVRFAFVLFRSTEVRLRVL